MRISYHNHTSWSDGKSSLPEMIEGARKAGLEELGISDHFALTRDSRRFSWALAPDFLDTYVEEILRAKKENQDLTIRLGLEVDYFPENLEMIKKRLAPYPFDFLIVSVHFIDGFVIDLNSQPWEEIPQEQRNRIWSSYWQYIRDAASSKFFDIIGHFDLPKKFNYYPSIDLTSEAMEALDAMAAADMTIEINCAGWDKPVKEAYPALFYLQEANRRKIPLIINADAHNAEDLVRNFDRAYELAASAGYTELVRFDQRRRISYPL